MTQTLKVEQGRVTEFQVKPQCEKGPDGKPEQISNGQYPRYTRYVGHEQMAFHYLDDGGSHV